MYSGYWLSVDQPGGSIEDPLQEEGIDTLRRVMEAAGISFAGQLCPLSSRTAPSFFSGGGVGERGGGHGGQGLSQRISGLL